MGLQALQKCSSSHTCPSRIQALGTLRSRYSAVMRLAAGVVVWVSFGSRWDVRRAVLVVRAATLDLRIHILRQKVTRTALANRMSRTARKWSARHHSATTVFAVRRRGGRRPEDARVSAGDADSSYLLVGATRNASADENTTASTFPTRAARIRTCTAAGGQARAVLARTRFRARTSRLRFPIAKLPTRSAPCMRARLQFRPARSELHHSRQ
jgi:hypothetical protein